jgi:glutamine amidotransferase
MCRLFGFKSVINSKVHSSLVHADNALVSQSVKHSDGWGVAYYLENVPHLIKSTDRALDDQIFHQISGIVSSQVVLAHLRKATQGQKTILNSHPFQYGNWVFAHNGNLKGFQSYKEELINLIHIDLKRFILGTTDSEIIFYLLLSHIKKRHCLSKPDIVLSDLKDAIKETCDKITSFSGPLCGDEKPAPTENHLTFIISTGKVMAALNGGQPLFYSTHKSLCSERETCEHFAPICESPVKQQEMINHLVFSSEKLLGENIWQELRPGEMVAVDNQMKFLKFNLDIDFTKDSI